MREAIGGTWLLGLVLTFIVFFASFLAISINYAKAFNVKNNIVDLLEKYEGNNKKAREHIASYLKDTGYLVTGSCPTSDENDEDPYDEFNYNGYNLDGENTNGGKAYFCISKDSQEETTISDKENDVLKKQYYRVIVFFKIDLPLIGELTTFRIRGETESIYFAVDDTV